MLVGKATWYMALYLTFALKKSDTMPCTILIFIIVSVLSYFYNRITDAMYGIKFYNRTTIFLKDHFSASAISFPRPQGTRVLEQVVGKRTVQPSPVGSGRTRGMAHREAGAGRRRRPRPAARSGSALTLARPIGH